MGIRSCLLLLLFIALPAYGQAPAAEPDSAQIITTDVENFWRAYDRLASAATRDDTVRILQEHYFDRATPGLAAFIDLRLKGVDNLLFAMNMLPAYYEAVRANTLNLAVHEPVIREVFHRLKAVYSKAVFPNMYFVVGGFSTQGMIAPVGLLIGAEMVSADESTPMEEIPDFMREVDLTASTLPCITVHELIHYQQNYGDGRSLLKQALVEGVADFLSDQAVGCFPTARSIYDFGDAHETELWSDFRQDMMEEDMSAWFYNAGKSGDRPANLGYWMGYQIAEAYFNQAADKEKAVHEMLNIQDVEAFVRQSGYNPVATD